MLDCSRIEVITSGVSNPPVIFQSPRSLPSAPTNPPRARPSLFVFFCNTPRIDPTSCTLRKSRTLCRSCCKADERKLDIFPCWSREHPLATRNRVLQCLVFLNSHVNNLFLCMPISGACACTRSPGMAINMTKVRESQMKRNASVSPSFASRLRRSSVGHVRKLHLENHWDANSAPFAIISFVGVLLRYLMPRGFRNRVAGLFLHRRSAFWNAGKFSLLPQSLEYPACRPQTLPGNGPL